MAVGHEVKVGVMPSMVTDGTGRSTALAQQSSGVRARCSCGWKGQPRSTVEAAKLDAAAHERVIASRTAQA